MIINHDLATNWPKKWFILLWIFCKQRRKMESERMVEPLPLVCFILNKRWKTYFTNFCYRLQRLK